MVTVALCLLLSATDKPAVTTLVMDPPAANHAALFDQEPPQAPSPSMAEDGRLKRFLGALSGGVVGLAAGLALMPAGDATTFCGVGPFAPPGGCVGGFHIMSGILAPLLSVTGAFLGYQLMGGEGSLLTAAAAMVPAVLVAMTLLAVAAEAGAMTTLELAPYFVASSAVLVGGAALALDLRGSQLSQLGGAASWGGAASGRVGLSSLVSLLTVGASVAGTTLVGVATCSGAGSPAFCVPFSAAVGAGLGALSALAVYGVHQALGGRGTLTAAMLGMGVALAMSGAIFGGFFAAAGGPFTTNFSQVRNTSGAILMTEALVIAGTFFPMLALEWSHTNAVKSSLPGISFSAAPVREGGMVAAAMRF